MGMAAGNASHATYKEIGLKMYQAYPCIAQTEKHPWVMSTSHCMHVAVYVYEIIVAAHPPHQGFTESKEFIAWQAS